MERMLPGEFGDRAQSGRSLPTTASRFRRRAALRNAPARYVAGDINKRMRFRSSLEIVSIAWESSYNCSGNYYTPFSSSVSCVFVAYAETARFHQVATFVWSAIALCATLTLIVEDPETVGILTYLETAWIIVG